MESSFSLDTLERLTFSEDSEDTGSRAWEYHLIVFLETNDMEPIKKTVQELGFGGGAIVVLDCMPAVLATL